MGFSFAHNPEMDKTIKEIVGKTISSLMQNSDDLDTCKKVAKKSGVGFGTVQRVSNGEINITIEKLTAIAQAFGRHPAELLVDPDKPYPASLPTPNELRPLAAREPEAPNIVAMPPPLLTELIKVAGTLSDAGLHRLIERAKQLSEEHPKALQQKDA